MEATHTNFVKLFLLKCNALDEASCIEWSSFNIITRDMDTNLLRIFFG